MNLTTLALMVVSAFPVCPLLAAQTPKSEVVYYADAYADHYGVSRALVRAIITQESGWNRFALSSKGAAGLMQLLPDTAAEYGVKDLFNVKDNLSGGVHYLADLLNQFHGRDETSGGGVLLRYQTPRVEETVLQQSRCCGIRSIGSTPIQARIAHRR
jgi:soluble lytic murein transglycosylase-like protein